MNIWTYSTPMHNKDVQEGIHLRVHVGRFYFDVKYLVWKEEDMLAIIPEYASEINCKRFT
ncbi:hypothetical protein [Paenibacillus marinisediminis]